MSCSATVSMCVLIVPAFIFYDIFMPHALVNVLGQRARARSRSRSLALTFFLASSSARIATALSKYVDNVSCLKAAVHSTAKVKDMSQWKWPTPCTVMISPAQLEHHHSLSPCAWAGESGRHPLESPNPLHSRRRHIQARP